VYIISHLAAVFKMFSAEKRIISHKKTAGTMRTGCLICVTDQSSTAGFASLSSS